MPKLYVTVLGKAVRRVARLRGSGSALPGLVVERIDPHFIHDTLATLPHGVVVISGTNGKTTTTKMVVELLESQGLTVFTNRTGSNFTRGVAAALLSEITMSGKLKADIAVLELDEAHATHFVATIKPRFSLILNVLRDQLDRFGEIDYTASLLNKIAQETTDIVVLNREDARIAEIGTRLKQAKPVYFGLAEKLLSTFPSDEDMRSTTVKDHASIPAEVVLTDFSDGSASFEINGTSYETPLKLTGVYNVYNAAAALALVQAIVDTKDVDSLIGAVASVTPAFGRGETFIVHGQPLEIVLVKNPSGFRLGLKSYSPVGYQTMIAINDNYADGRDMSWLWDVDFESLRETGVAAISGSRAYDMALRLQYDDVPFESTSTDLKASVENFLKEHTGEPKRIYATYTAMLAIRKQLSSSVKMEGIG